MLPLRPRRALALASCLALAAGIAQARPQPDAAQGSAGMDAMSLASAFAPPDQLDALGLDRFEDCHAFCDDEAIDAAPNMECWGKFVWYCGNKTAGGVGVTCNGHWESFRVPDQDMAVASCEGLKQALMLHFHTCPKTGKKVKIFYGSGCLGTSSTKMTHSGAHDEDATLGSTVAGLLHEASTEDARLEALIEGDGGSGAPVWGEHAFTLESRCKGMGGQVQAFKWGEKANEGDEEGDSSFDLYEQMQAAFEAATGGLDMLSTSPSDGTPEQPVLGSLVRAAGDADADAGSSDLGHMSCSLTCNGKEPWWHGALPCWGKLSIECQSAPSPGASASARRPLAEARGHAGLAAITRPAALSGEKSASFKGSCMGLWTGVLGHMCLGETLVHADKEWDTGSFDRFDICSGKLGMHGSKGDGRAHSHVWCRGAGVMRVGMTHTEVPSTA